MHVLRKATDYVDYARVGGPIMLAGRPIAHRSIPASPDQPPLRITSKARLQDYDKMFQRPAHGGGDGVPHTCPGCDMRVTAHWAHRD